MFWIFVAVVVIAGVWRKTTLRREELATIRVAIEKGQSLDPALLDRVLRESPTKTGAMITGALATIAAGIGLGILGVLISVGGNPEAMYPLLGVGILVTLIGLALLAGDRLDQRRARSER
jgi:hypothetical protein